MPAKSQKQANYFKLVRAVQKGDVPSSEVSKKLRTTAASISPKDASDFTHTESISLTGIASEILKEELETSVARNIKAEVDDLEAFLSKPENAGSIFSQSELEATDSTEFKPNSKTSTQIKYSKTDDITNDNKELIVIKRQNRYLGYYSISKPVDLTPEEPLESPEGEQSSKEKTVVIIKVSKPFEQGKTEDISLLTNFITELVNEFQLK